MAASHGSKAVLKVHDGTSLRDISSYVTQTGMKRMRELAETSTIGGTTYKSFITGLRDATIPIDGNYDPTVDGYLTAMFDSDTALAWEFSPYGTTATYKKYSGTALLTTLDIDTGVSDKGGITGELQVTGAITAGTN